MLGIQSYLDCPAIRRFRPKHVHNVLLKTSDGLETFFWRYSLSENARQNMAAEKKRERAHGFPGCIGRSGVWVYQAFRQCAKQFLPPRRIGM